jgi:hypothetical protein
MEHETDPDEASPVTDVEAEPAGEPAASPSGAEVAVDAAGKPASAAAPPGTGEPRVDAALRLLDLLPGLPVSEHPELFELVHAKLTDVLGELDSGSAGLADPHGS